MKKIKRKSILKVFILCLLAVVWISWDFIQASKKIISLYKSYEPAHKYNSVTSAITKVGIIRSDDSSLTHPVSASDASIGYETIEEMIRRAVELAGGFHWLIKSGDMVLLKPNIVEKEPSGSGVITDVRVIKALIKLIDEIDHGNIEIVVGEGSPLPMEYEMKYQTLYNTPQWQKLWDFAGYQDLLTDSGLVGINLRLSNLNGSPPENPWQDLVLVDVPGGGLAGPQGGRYYIHKDVLDADVYITVPVMKIHTPGMTVALKNQIGLAASTRYGFWKTKGVPQDNYRTKLVHNRQAPVYWTDKEIVDLSNIADIKFAVVDAIACLESQKSAKWKNGVVQNLVRMNTIVAGPDPVAVDHVCARLMGLNPDDIEHITLAERIGLGTNNPDQITILGSDLDQIKKRFRKNSEATADFGQGIRYWLINGPYATDGVTDPINHAFIDNETNLKPKAGEEGWSDPVYFTEDRIDLNDYFNNPGKVIGYAFCYFDAPRDQEAELWIGSDEALKIFINGELVYTYNSTRSYSSSKFVSTKVKTFVREGENRLLVKAMQKYGYYQFCLNICEPEANSDFDGNRIWGLKFKTESNNTAVKQNVHTFPVSYRVRDAYPNPFNHQVRIAYQVSNPGPMHIAVYNTKGQKIRMLFNDNMTEVGEKKVTWDGKDDNENIMASGLYLITFQGSGHSIISKKITLLK